MAPEIQVGERYASQVGELWSGLAQTLASLETIAVAPERLGDSETVEALRRLQYRLHVAGESVLGLSPPAAAEPAHGELAAALTEARDATAEIVETVESCGRAGAEIALYEWRGALFHVRLARLRLAAPRPAPSGEGPPPTGVRAPMVAVALTIAGATAFAVGATFALWPVWAAGALAVCVSLLFHRP